MTYVAAQLGHAKPTTTLDWYAHWVPTAESTRYADILDAKPIDAEMKSYANFGTNSRFPAGSSKSRQISKGIGGWEMGRPRLELGTR